MFKTYKKLEAAKAAAGGRPFLRIGNMFIVATDPDRHDIMYTRVQIVAPDGKLGKSIPVSAINLAGEG